MAATEFAGYPITRRAVLKGGSLVGLSAFLAACGGSSSTPAPSNGAPATTGPAATPAPTTGGTPEPITGPLNFANWPAYIDLNDDESASPTLDEFRAKYGIEVKYVEDVQTNEDGGYRHRGARRAL